MSAHDNIAFVLFKPRYAGNVGAAARAIKNMGFADLRLVAPELSDRRDASAMAVHADDVLAAARTFPDLAAALADATITVGTTCRDGPYRNASRPPRDTAAHLASLAETNSIAIVFGPEDRGLTNDELKLCHRLIAIPASPEYPSLNLAQAVMVIAYEMRLALETSDTAPPPLEFVPSSDSEAMLDRMTEALLAIGFLPENNPDHIMFALRGIFGRSGLTAREVDILNGMARQIRWAGGGGFRTIEEKRRSGKKLR
ncbi:MAG: RNA methyltransferase [Candidatus Binatus sp.]|uniref:RNA methyltransferase n=1 Tax=Candidatus Binatus sp. TaxID=2811406 RepID=UPI002716E1DC|nr:RNA methyltransferase [Candidatus Binatus sp.]MDO8432635.1 RNA methyltransferase [Candidatus Binatus sp.]